jgi:hypothetical protein
MTSTNKCKSCQGTFQTDNKLFLHALACDQPELPQIQLPSIDAYDTSQQLETNLISREQLDPGENKIYNRILGLESECQAAVAQGNLKLRLVRWGNVYGMSDE